MQISKPRQLFLSNHPASSTSLLLESSSFRRFGDEKGGKKGGEEEKEREKERERERKTLVDTFVKNKRTHEQETES